MSLGGSVYAPTDAVGWPGSVRTEVVALLPGHGDPPLVFGGDGVVVVVRPMFELDPGEGADAPARIGCVVEADCVTHPTERGRPVDSELRAR